MIPYVEDFYSQADADEFFEFIKTQPFVRPPNPRNKTYRLKRLSFPGYSPPIPPTRAARKFKPPSNYDVSRPVEEAPPLYRKFAERLSAYAGKEINYMSTIGYLPDDHMDFHQHAEDKGREDQTVWVLSLGAVHPVAIRPKGCKDKSQWEIIHPKHGSLFVLPSSYNLTHEHAVLCGNDYSHGGLRIGINAKHIQKDFIEMQLAKDAAEKYGKLKKEKKEVIIATNGMQSIYCCREGCEHPADAVYVGRKYGKFPNTPFGNHKRLNGDAWREEVAELMKSPEFRSQVEALRGKDLLCWCLPKEAGHCHARVWLELANAVKPGLRLAINTKHIPANVNEDGPAETEMERSAKSAAKDGKV